MGHGFNSKLLDYRVNPNEFQWNPHDIPMTSFPIHLRRTCIESIFRRLGCTAEAPRCDEMGV